jgi:hypothetical protein
MKRKIFITTIIVCAAFFLSFLITDELYVPDRGLQQVYESALLAVTLGSIGVTASKYYADTSTDAVIRELKRLESKFEQKIENLESKFEQQQNNKDST